MSAVISNLFLSVSSVQIKVSSLKNETNDHNVETGKDLVIIKQTRYVVTLVRDHT